MQLPPWWERWPSWWAEQQRQVRRRWGKGQGYKLDAVAHTAVWTGSVFVPGAPGTDRIGVRIDWGSATPFFAPRVTFPTCPSVLHQLNDGSACLVSPVDPVNGWEGPLDAEFWMERAEQWLGRYFAENWAVPPETWALYRLVLPGYRYRQVLAETRIVALPGDWRDVEPGFGRVRVRLPTGKGIGAVVAWETRSGRWERWAAGEALVSGPHDSVDGLWARFGPGTFMTFKAPSVNRRFGKVLADEWTHAAREGRERVFLISMIAAGGGGESPPWIVMRHAAPGLLEDGQDVDPLHHLMALVGVPDVHSIGMPFHDDTLDARRRAGRSDTMHSAIGETQIVLAGLGSLGSEIAHLLAQEGFRNFYLVDGDLFLPGNEARHRAGIANAGRPKVEVVADLIRGVQPEATVKTHQGWIDELVPTLANSAGGPRALIIGATGDEGTEHFLGDVAAWMGTPCVHAWLEADGQVLRAMKFTPGSDPTISAVSVRSETPRLPPMQDPLGPRICADTVLPGSALSIHAAANFVVRVVVDVVAGHAADANHWLFAPGGLNVAGGPPELVAPYGVLATSIPVR